METLLLVFLVTIIINVILATVTWLDTRQRHQDLAYIKGLRKEFDSALVTLAQVSKEQAAALSQFDEKLNALEFQLQARKTQDNKPHQTFPGRGFP